MLKSFYSQSLANLFREVKAPSYKLVQGEDDDDEDDEDFHILELDDIELQGSLESSAAHRPSRERALSLSFEITLTDQSRLLRIDHIQQISRHFPSALTVCTWSLVYSTHSHGSSLRTLYRNMAKWDCCTLIVIRDNHGQVFGAFCSSPLKVSSSFYGTGQGFLFSLNPRLQVYRWTSANSYFINGGKESLAFGGGGGQFGLWLCGDLIRGRSQRCETFDNDLLSAAEDFFIDELEVWALV
ncbi:TLD domain-containing protein 2-like isoform X2 [Clupea harengus]|uniref:Oxidation resistance protein 1 n=1 Tax=Clupea harengus TaxID=7950 RepID=A0A6P8F162_CLUHA|nr:TLD domain-containing protein 2-like isoform X1 [Clupea harengus]XP_031422264.1 TLD domain-containing protein 2-like isoform X2 [Clupea harengus]